MAEEYTDRGFNFVFLYTREAHPGENFPAHRSMEQKIAHARAFEELFHVKRPILVDDLVGSVHKAYGELPNMTYLVSRGGTVLFRADWTDPPTIKWALDYFLDARARRREGLRLGPFYAEIVGYRWSDQQRFQAGLERAGQQAVDDFAQAIGRGPGIRARPGRIVLED
jgi:hypothetical protein